MEDSVAGGDLLVCKGLQKRSLPLESAFMSTTLAAIKTERDRSGRDLSFPISLILQYTWTLATHFIQQVQRVLTVVYSMKNSKRYPGLESYKFVEERPPSFCFFYKETLKLKTLVRKLLTEIAWVKQPLVKIKMFLLCTLMTCELLIQAFDDLYIQICEVDQQITLAHVKAIPCSGRPSGISLEDQVRP
ncbi:hypothetical protein C8J55DRAFT_560393 [Lentinula edodes]|uniref:Uncharacterized protein n=1 Tax=Lentinula lateritia TaxID=40482 RepID=A0A9W9ADP9_9AGAR|nr:hypothetical protein C8J55DRAFT_560393 [Lentinula edodes]